MIDCLKNIEEMLFLGKSLFEKYPRLTNEVGTINSGGDATIEMDVEIERALIHFVKNRNLPFDMFSEEIGFKKLSKKSEFLLVLDPLDGSTNYKLGQNLFPYGLMIAVYKGTSAKLKDVVASGAYECTTGKGWLFDGKNTVNLITKRKVLINNNWVISKSTPVHLDLYYKKAYEVFSVLPEKLHIKWGGSNISSLLYVLTGVSTAMGALTMKPEEIGAIVSLIKGAGGVTVDHQGKDLNEYDFSINNTYPVLAGDPKVVRFVVDQLKQR